MKKYLLNSVTFIFEIVLIAACWPWRKFLLNDGAYVSFFELFESKDPSVVISSSQYSLGMKCAFAYLSFLIVLGVSILIIFFFEKKWIISSVVYLIQAIAFTVAFAFQPSNVWVIPLVWFIFALNGFYLFMVGIDFNFENISKK